MLDAKGYAGASMLAIARQAKASNETLYNWYGDKNGLFRALVVRNAGEVRIAGRLGEAAGHIAKRPYRHAIASGWRCGAVPVC